MHYSNKLPAGHGMRLEGELVLIFWFGSPLIKDPIRTAEVSGVWQF